MTRSQKLWRSLLVAVIALPLGSLLYQGIRQYREATTRQTTKDRLKQIELALHQYHDEYRTFPPAFVQGPDGRMWHSWRTLLLPYLGEQELAAKYRFDEPWDGPHNRELAAKCPEVFQSPHWGTELGRTNFYGVIGRRTAWPAQHAISRERALDGPSNTIHLVEGPPVAQWLEPRDLGVREWTQVFRNQPRPASYITCMDGAVRKLSKNIDQTLLVSLLTPRYGELMYSGPDWPTDLIDSVESAEYAGSWKTKDVRELLGTEVVAAASVSLDSKKNQFWCATFQITWDELSSQVGGPVKTSPASPLADGLNAEPFDRRALSPQTYMALATGASLSETQNLKSQVQQKFPQMVPEVESFPDDGNRDWRLYACLVKAMPFVEQMDRFPWPLSFGAGNAKSNVVSFGRQPGTPGGLGGVVLQDQVVVGDYVSDEDFVLILKTNSPQQDEIILARTPVGETLRSLWNNVSERLRSPNPHRVYKDLHDADRLEIPILELGVSKRFGELEGLSVAGLSSENHIAVARESILFRLDEKGAEIIAEAESMVVGENGFPEVPFDPTKPRRFVFDQPFFIALREQGASEPYFLGWIAHPEVMVRSASSP